MLEAWGAAQLDGAATAVGAGGPAAAQELEHARIELGALAERIQARRRFLLRVGEGGDRRYLAIVGCRRGRVDLATPRGTQHAPLAQVLAVAAGRRTDAGGAIETLGAAIGCSRRARDRLAAAAVIAAHDAPVDVLEARPRQASIARRAAAAGVGRGVAHFLVAYASYYVLWIASFWLLLQGVTTPGDAGGWYVGWFLTLVTAWLVRLLAIHQAGVVSLELSSVLRTGALDGLLRRPAEAANRQGTGELFGKVLELGALEAVGMRGAFNVVFASLELILTGVALGLLGATFHLWALLGWCVLIALLAVRYARVRARWTRQRLRLAMATIENLVGHAACLVQRDARERAATDERNRAQYLAVSREFDRAELWLCNLVPRGWIVVSSLALIPPMVAGTASATVAAMCGASLLAFRAMRPLVEGLAWVSEALLGARAVQAVAAPEVGEVREVGGPDADVQRPSAPLLARGLRLRRDHRVLLEACDLTLAPGDKVVLDGPSGAGKSTLARVLAGISRDGEGLILVGGIDAQAAGESAWARRVCYVPQFGSNHVFHGTFAQNLLLHRPWPASREDLEEAEQACAELGLGPLLARMPAGIHTVIGETGWRLSHGEQARLFMARGLLRRADITIIDESLAAFDPATFEEVRATLARRAGTFLIIAHP